MILVLDGDGLGKAGQHVFHQPRFGSALPLAGMGHNDGLAQLGVQNAVGAFDGHQAAGLGRKRGVEGAAALRAGQRRLRLRRAGKSPHRTSSTGRGIHSPSVRPSMLARFGVGKDNLPGALQKHQNRQAIENLALRIGIRVFVIDSIPWPPRALPRFPPAMGLPFRHGSGA